jgi:S1-C subfamily serine protease
LDLAALKIDAGGLPTIALGESTKLRPGELVLSLGHPWGVEGAVTAGVVISIGVARQSGRLLEGAEWRGQRHADREWITASLHVRPGHSGGPMVDAGGRLVGINTIMAGPGVGVAVPVHVAKAFLKAAMAN